MEQIMNLKEEGLSEMQTADHLQVSGSKVRAFWIREHQGQATTPEDRLQETVRKAVFCDAACLPEPIGVPP